MVHYLFMRASSDNIWTSRIIRIIPHNKVRVVQPNVSFSFTAENVKTVPNSTMRHP